MRIGTRDGILFSWAISVAWLLSPCLLGFQTSPLVDGVLVEDMGLELAYVEIIV